ncbi:hypothetical protein FRB96_001987 [Tulasnella sp. 330]|nr:hypothetical protein FRB96_001987 [Tulasnella sp. 330]
MASRVPVGDEQSPYAALDEICSRILSKALPEKPSHFLEQRICSTLEAIVHLFDDLPLNSLELLLGLKAETVTEAQVGVPTNNILHLDMLATPNSEIAGLQEQLYKLAQLHLRYACYHWASHLVLAQSVDTDNGAHETPTVKLAHAVDKFCVKSYYAGFR